MEIVLICLQLGFVIYFTFYVKINLEPSKLGQALLPPNTKLMCWCVRAACNFQRNINPHTHVYSNLVFMDISDDKTWYFFSCSTFTLLSSKKEALPFQISTFHLSFTKPCTLNLKTTKKLKGFLGFKWNARCIIRMGAYFGLRPEPVQ